jgi:hypothetical protein
LGEKKEEEEEEKRKRKKGSEAKEKYSEENIFEMF